VILPTQPHIMAKRTLHPAWPVFLTERGKAIRYGPEICPRTIDILGRFGGVMIDPKFSSGDVQDVIAAVRKVFPEMIRA
jgi:hypothetical protein